MKAVVFDGELRTVTDRPVPEPARNEAVIRTRLAGICTTDLEIIRGYRGFKGVLGHEFVGIVEEVNGDAPHLSGRRVVGEINCGCGTCECCRKGLKRHCPNRVTLGISGKDGALAEYVTLPVDNLYEVPRAVRDEEAVFAEPLAAAFEIIEQVHIKPTDNILVIGDGKLGLLAVLVLTMTQARVILGGRHEAKLSIARNQGVTAAEIKDLPKRKIYDVVVEATGAPEGFELALDYVKPMGTIILKTTAAEGKTINLAPVVVDEVRVVGSRCGPFEPALRALSEKRIRVGPLISGIYGFSRIGEAFEKAEKATSLKVLVDFSR